MKLPRFRTINEGLTVAQDASQRFADATRHFQDGMHGATRMVGRRRNLVERVEGAAVWLSNGAKVARLLVPFIRRGSR